MFEGLNFDVGLNASRFTSGIKAMQSQTVSFDNTIQKLGRTIAGVFGAVSITMIVKKSISLWAEQEQAMMKLSIAAQRFTLDAQGVYSRVSKLSSELQHLTGVGNETYISIAALGLSLGISETKIENATKAAALLSQVTGMDLNTAMKNLAKTQAGLTGELGEALPFLRELTAEQLKNGQAIDLIVQKYDGFAEQLSKTTQVSIKRFWSALGDIGEVFGKVFNPVIQKAADWIENFSSKIKKPSDILTALGDTLKEAWQNMSTFMKVVVGLGGAFVGLKVAGTAWHLLSRIIVSGGTIMVGVFKSIFSWPFLMIAGLYTLRVAWDHDWLGIRGIVSKAGEAIGNVLESMGIHVENFQTNAKKAFDEVKTSWEELTKATDAQEFMKGLVALGSDILQIPARIIFGENEGASFKSKLLNVITWGGLVFAIPGSHPVLEIAAVILSLGLTDRFKEELKNTNSALRALEVLAEEVYNSIATIGAGLTELLGGDSQKYLDSTNSALEKMSATIKEIGETESIAKKFDLSVELAEEIYQIPAKFLVSGFIDNFDQAWIDNALSMLAVVGITKFMGGSWRMAVGLALVSDVILGDNVSSDGLVNSIVKSLEAGAATWLLTKSSKLGLGVSLVIMGWEAGKDFGEWLVSAGIGDKWYDWLTQTLGDWSKDVLAGLKTETFIDQLKASGIYMGLTILAGLKWPFDQMLKFGEWIWQNVVNAWNEFWEAGKEIGSQIIAGIASVFGLGWLVRLADKGTKPAESLSQGENIIPKGEHKTDLLTGRTSGGRSGEAWRDIGGGGETRFSPSEMMNRIRGDLSTIYAAISSDITGVLQTGPRIPVDETLTGSIQEAIERAIQNPLDILLQEIEDEASELRKAVKEQEQVMSHAGIVTDITSVASPTMEKISPELITGLNLGMIDPRILSALAYAESKYVIQEISGTGKGPFQWEIGAYTDISKRWLPTTMEHTEAATEPTYAILGTEYYLNWLKNYGKDALETLAATIVGWNRGRTTAQTWLKEGATPEDLPKETKILLTNFMVGLEQLTKGDWESLGNELRNEVAEVADLVNYFVDNFPEEISKSFVGEPYKFEVLPEAETQELAPAATQATTQIDISVFGKTHDELVSFHDTVRNVVFKTLDDISWTALNTNGKLELFRISTDNWFKFFGEKLIAAGYSSGGYISGEGGPTEDKIPAFLSNGEFVINAKATQKWLPLLERINKNGFADGGIAKFAIGTATMLTAGEISQPLSWWDYLLQGLSDFKETLGKDLSLVKSLFTEMFKVFGLDIEAPFEEIETKLEEFGSLLTGQESKETFEEFFDSILKSRDRLQTLSSVLNESQLQTLGRQMNFLEATMSNLEQQFISGEIGLEAFIERMLELQEVSKDLKETFDALKKKIRFEEEVKAVIAGGSELWDLKQLTDGTNELVSTFESLDDVGNSMSITLLTQLMNLEAINKLLNPISTFMSGMMEVFGPFFNSLFKPLSNLLIALGRLWGAFNVLYQILHPTSLIITVLLKSLGWLSATISYVSDWFVLMIDKLFTWLDSIPVLTWIFDPLLTEEQRKELRKTIPERMEELTPPQSSTGQTFQAGSSQNIVYNYYFEFRENHILTEDEESVRRFADLIYKNLRDRGHELQVG